jgi:hypothetical protein
MMSASRSGQQWPAIISEQRLVVVEEEAKGRELRET